MSDSQQAAPVVDVAPVEVVMTWSRFVVRLWAVVLSVAFALLLWRIVPWDWLPGGNIPAADPTADLPAQQLAEIEDYQAAVRPYEIGATVVPVFFVLALGFTPVGSRLVEVTTRRVRLWQLQVLLGTAVVVAVASVLRSLFLAFVERARNAEGFISAGWQPWVSEQIGFFVTAWACASALLLTIIVFSRRLPLTWPVPVALLAVGLTMLGVVANNQLAQPSSGLPSLPAGELRTELLALGDELGVPLEDVVVVPETTGSASYNAHVAGYGDAEQLVIFETMLRLSTPEEVQVVAAHEIGHIAEDDGLTNAVLTALAAAVGAALLGPLTGSRIVRRAAGVSLPIGAPGVPLLLALILALTAPLVMLLEGASRAREARADVFALEATRDPRALEGVLDNIATLNLEDPLPPLPVRLLSGHPSVAQRQALVQGWRERSR